MARLISHAGRDRPVLTPPPPVSQLSSQAQKRRSAESSSWTIRCQLVTPLLGGGPKAGHVDEVTPVSAKGIRGQLRFWWRMIRGPLLVNNTGLDPIELLLLRESEIFGSSDAPSPFDLSVAITQHEGYREYDRRQPFEFDQYGPEMYALFPTTQDSQRTPPRILREGLQFRVEIAWLTNDQFSTRIKYECQRRREDNQRRLRDARRSTQQLPPPWSEPGMVHDELRAALWAWLNFGGLGSRTRRGLGAVSTCDSGYACLCDQGRVRYPLSDMIVLIATSVVTPMTSALEAWRTTLAMYRDFRQGCRGPRHRKDRLKFDRRTRQLRIEKNVSVPAGRTAWPEPDSIRLQTGCHLRGDIIYIPKVGPYEPHDHAPTSTEARPLPRYPRAQLGLPINFHFADGPGPASAAAKIPRNERDPDMALLVPQVVDLHGKRVPGQRMASPVLTRPILVDGHWLPALVILPCPGAHTLEAYLKYGRTSVPVPNSQIVDHSLCVSERKDQRHADTLAALRSFAEARGFTLDLREGQD